MNFNRYFLPAVQVKRVEIVFNRTTRRNPILCIICLLKVSQQRSGAGRQALGGDILEFLRVAVDHIRGDLIVVPHAEQHVVDFVHRTAAR